MDGNRGFVYFAHSEGRVKIGTTSRDVQNRLTAISASLAVPLELIGTLEGGLRLERAVQKHLAAHQIKGEWFRDTPELRAQLIELIDKGPVAVIGYKVLRDTVGLVQGDLEAQCALHRDQNLVRMISKLWADNPAEGMAEFTGLSKRYCQAIIDRETSAPRVVRLAILVAFILWFDGARKRFRHNLSPVLFEHRG